MGYSLTSYNTQTATIQGNFMGKILVVRYINLWIGFSFDTGISYGEEKILYFRNLYLAGSHHVTAIIEFYLTVI